MKRIFCILTGRRERQLETELARIREEGQLEAYSQQSQGLIRQLKKDYKRQTMD